MKVLHILALVLLVDSALAVTQWETAQVMRPVFSWAFNNCNQTVGQVLFAENSSLPYVGCFDTQHLAPSWTANLIILDQRTENGRPDVDPWIVPQNLQGFKNGAAMNGRAFEDAYGQKWDRGHLTPNSDMPDAKTKEGTFNVINRAPQLAKINQGVWRCAENAARNAHAPLRQSLLIITKVTYNQQIKKSKYGLRGNSTDQPQTREKRNGAITTIPQTYNKLVYMVDASALANSNSLQLLAAACVTQDNLDVASQPGVFSWDDCPGPVKFGFPEPLTTSNMVLKDQINVILYGSKSPSPRGQIICT